MPPVGWASRLTACAQYALIETIEMLALLNRLEVFLVWVFFGCLSLEIRVNLLVLCIEVRHVDTKVLQHEHEHEW